MRQSAGTSIWTALRSILNVVTSVVAFAMSEVLFGLAFRGKLTKCPVAEDLLKLYELRGTDADFADLFDEQVLFEDPFLRVYGRAELMAAFSAIKLIATAARVPRHTAAWKTNQKLVIYNVQEYTLRLINLPVVIPSQVELVFGESGKIIAYRDRTMLLPIISRATWGFIGAPVQALRRFNAHVVFTLEETL